MTIMTVNERKRERELCRIATRYSSGRFFSFRIKIKNCAQAISFIFFLNSNPSGGKSISFLKDRDSTVHLHFPNGSFQKSFHIVQQQTQDVSSVHVHKTRKSQEQKQGTSAVQNTHTHEIMN